MNEKTNTTMLFKTINYTNEIRFNRIGGAGGRRQLIKSLKHSLRIPSASHKKLEWVEEMSHKNLIWTGKTGITLLEKFSISQREALLKKVSADAQLSTIGNEDRSLLVKLRSKLKNAINNSCKNETEEAVIEAFQSVLSIRGIVDADRMIEKLVNFTIVRKSQKLDTIKKFIECHNKIERSGRFAIKKNNAVVQEAFFKFPARNKVAGIPPEDRIKLIKGFYDKLFPEYPICFIVLHGDEDIDKAEYSDHPHLFVSTRNTKTGLHDLKGAQIRRVNSYLKRYHPSIELISDKPNFSESQILFGYLQEMFYRYTNNTLLKDTQYRAKKLERTEQHNEKLRTIRKEAFKPKSERHFNLYELSKNRVAELETTLMEREKELALVELELSAAGKRTYRALALERSAQEMAAESVEETAMKLRELNALSKTLNKIKSEHADIAHDYNHIKGQLDIFMSSVSGMIESFMLWLENLHGSRKHELEQEYLSRAAKYYSNIVENDDTPTKVYTEAADKALEAQMAFMEKLIANFSGAPAKTDLIKRIKNK
jgi:hypothetical protein